MSRPGQRVATIAIVACAALWIASSAGASAPSHASFVAKADALCASQNTRAKRLGSPKTLAAAVPYLTRVIALVTHLKTATLALPAPSKDEALVQQGMTALGFEIDYLGLARTAAKAGNQKRFNDAMNRASQFHDDAQMSAKSLGLKVCGG